MRVSKPGKAEPRLGLGLGQGWGSGGVGVVASESIKHCFACNEWFACVCRGLLVQTVVVCK